jgi:hypothetical protein
MTRVFISYAHEDRTTVARPVAERLRSRGYEVWFDEYVLRVGDSLIGQIDEGLAKCDHAVVVLSPSFFARHWPQRELKGLATREIASERKIVLPVWHDVEAEFIARYSPPLADKVAAKTRDGLAAVLEALAAAMGPAASGPSECFPYSDFDLINAGYPERTFVVSGIEADPNRSIDKHKLVHALRNLGKVVYYSSFEIGSSINPNYGVDVILEARASVQIEDVRAAVASGGLPVSAITLADASSFVQIRSRQRKP